MFVTYFDETGDDGYPQYSSALFVLSTIYFPVSVWKNNYQLLMNLRKDLKNQFNFPIKTEIHTKQLLLNKRPYNTLNWDNETRKQIIITIARTIANLNMKAMSCCINKLKINDKNLSRYKDVNETAFTFDLQRIENDIKPTANLFMAIVDEGRLGKMRRTARKLQKINYIPSKFNEQTYQVPLSCMIEDPLAKDSKESPFIQICDFISYFSYIYVLSQYNIADMRKRSEWFGKDEVVSILDILRPIFNTAACSYQNPYALIIYPK